MSRSRGALSATSVDNDYSYQVMLRLTPATRKRMSEIHHLAAEVRAYGLGHWFQFEEENAEYSVFCFQTFIEAETFLKAYGGEFLSAADRKKQNWRPRSRVVAKPWPTDTAI